MTRQILPFAIATLTPVFLLVAGALFGGIWLWGALGYLTVLSFALDRILRPGAPATQEYGIWADRLSALLAILHFAILGLGIWALAGGWLSPFEKVIAFTAFGLFIGQVSNANAHELIHRPKRGLFLLGKWVFISQLFGHHTSAHRLVHHRYVATPSDPNTADFGESYYHFAPRAWIGSFKAGYRAEKQRPNPYISYIAGAGFCLGIAAVIGGVPGILALLALSGHGVAQLLMSDYVQHYGLRRGSTPEGRPNPLGPQHSWDAAQRFSSLLMLNAPRHADHHNHPTRPYPNLELAPGAMVLPRSLPVMGMIALFPPIWRRMVHPILARSGQNA